MSGMTSISIKLIGRKTLTQNPEDTKGVEMNQQKQVHPAICVISIFEESR